MEGEEKRVFLVTEGDYSDFHIYAAFDDKALAQKWCDAYCKGGDVEEYGLNPNGGELRKGLYRWLVWLWRNGDVRKVSLDVGGAPDRWYWALHEYPPRDAPKRRYYEVHCVAPDELTAVKIANERRAQSLACGEADKLPASKVGTGFSLEEKQLFEEGEVEDG